MIRKNDSNNDEECGSIDREKEAVLMMNAMTLFGGPAVGFNTNPETEKRPCFMVVNGEKIVCLAQGGECRYNYKYYSPGLNDKKSWTTPIVDIDCPDRCCYKSLVCDDHDEKCEGSVTYYPHYNKFRGQFKRYCRNLDKYVNNKVDDSGNVEKDEKGKDIRKVSKRNVKIGKTDVKIGKTDEKGKSGRAITWDYH